jgi:hypothetical protein
VSIALFEFENYCASFITAAAQGSHTTILLVHTLSQSSVSGGKQVNIKFMLIIRLVPVDNLKEIIRYIFKKHNRLWFAQDNLVSRHINQQSCPQGVELKQ